MSLARDLQRFPLPFLPPSSPTHPPLLGMIRDRKDDEKATEQSKGGRKRRRAGGAMAADDPHHHHHHHLPQQNQKSPPQSHVLDFGVDLNQSLQQHLAMAPTALNACTGNSNVVNVCTGLRLAFVDEEQRSTVTSSRPDHHQYAAASAMAAPPYSVAAAISLTDELSAHLSKHHDELDHLLRSQAEQLRQAMEDRAQRHSRALLKVVESDLSKQMAAKEAELEQAMKRNMELQETVKQVSMESQLWQSKARSNEAMVAILRSNLQQAVMVQQSREQSKLVEGCGESSEADDAASAYIDHSSRAAPMKMMNPASAPTSAPIPLSFSSSASSLAMATRACRLCRVKEASVVLLPCLHLCLCSSCKDRPPHCCPICSSIKSASVEVFLS